MEERGKSDIVSPNPNRTMITKHDRDQSPVVDRLIED